MHREMLSCFHNIVLDVHKNKLLAGGFFDGQWLFPLGPDVMSITLVSEKDETYTAVVALNPSEDDSTNDSWIVFKYLSDEDMDVRVGIDGDSNCVPIEYIPDMMEKWSALAVRFYRVHFGHAPVFDGGHRRGMI